MNICRLKKKTKLYDIEAVKRHVNQSKSEKDNVHACVCVCVERQDPIVIGVYSEMKHVSNESV